MKVEIFHCHLWESIKELIHFCGVLDFVHMYDLCRWKFLHKIHDNFSHGVTLLKHIDNCTDYFECVHIIIVICLMLHV